MLQEPPPYLLALQPTPTSKMECHERHESGHYWFGWTWSYGHKILACHGCSHCYDNNFADKMEDAHKLGADEVLLSTNKDEMAKQVGEFDFLLNTIPVNHDVNPYLDLLKVDATMCVVGAVEPLDQVNAAQLMFGRKRMAGSIIGGIQETQEMLNYCAEKNIVSEVEMIEMTQINYAFESLVANNVKYRFVIDMKGFAN